MLIKSGYLFKSMNNKLAISNEHRIVITYRVEPGCLGPDGHLHVQAFCDFAQQQMASLDAAYVQWQIVPRYDKSRPEMECRLMGKSLNAKQANQYFAPLGQNFGVIESHLCERISLLIDHYLQR